MSKAYNKRKELLRQAIHDIIQEHGHCTPELLLETARPKDSPIHGFFEWNAKNAAEQYRLIQAAAFLRSIHISLETEQGETVRVREFVHLSREEPLPEADEEPDSGRGRYVTITQAMGDSESRQAVVMAALSELRAFNRKYAAISLLAGVRQTIEAAILKAESLK